MLSKKYLHRILIALLGISILSCKNNKSETLFELMPANKTGIDFENTLTYDEEYNPYTYRSFYNGGGVAIGDINGDSLPDVFFTGNRVPCRMYINKGNFTFEDVTKKAGLWRDSVWATGATFADINGDGHLDLYICKSGKPDVSYRYNELFINKGDGTFIEQAKEWGIADLGLSVHAAFFDYDKDGDLDAYLLNNSMRPVGNYDFRTSLREVRDTLGGNKLYRNEGDHFVDVSAQAGIFGSNIGFGLGVTVGDINRDGWDDLFVSNDFFEHDYLYINQQNGTFKEVAKAQMPELSLGSMGADMADLNNDGWPDVFVTEMLPESEKRFKTKAKFDDWNHYLNYLRAGYHRQFPRNALHVNNGNGTFSEMSRMTGVAATDWSWGALMADFDNDGFRDIFVANGIYKDLLDQDYIQFASPYTVKQMVRTEEKAITKLFNTMPSEAISNYCFQNKGDWQFENKAQAWGLSTPSFSNGSAYADLDNDGDLDLVVNNVNMPCFVYKNKAETVLPKHRWLQLKLKGLAKNSNAIGTTVTIKHQQKQWFAELAPMRGFQSTVDDKLHFGLDTLAVLDSIIVDWPDGRQTILTQQATNTCLFLSQADAKAYAVNTRPAIPTKQVFTEFPLANAPEHKENEFSDFDQDRLLFHMRSYEGPHAAVGDINGDKLEDLFIGNGAAIPAAFWLQNPNGSFTQQVQKSIASIPMADVTAAHFFDADNDGDKDLYVATGGSEFAPNHPALADYLFENDEKGQFSPSKLNLPQLLERNSSVQSADINRDGRLDLLLGVSGTQVYGAPGGVRVLLNTSNGFVEAQNQWNTELANCGMVTSLASADLNADTWPDLVVVGEWMPPRIFINEQGKRFKAMAPNEKESGLYHSIALADVNNDQLPDIILGNCGLNQRFKADVNHTFQLAIGDFDKNGSEESIWSAYNGDNTYPILLRHDLVSQLPMLKKKYLQYSAYQSQTVADILSGLPGKITATKQVSTQYSQIGINKGNAVFEYQHLPQMAQVSPIYAITAADFNDDQHTDLLLGGNFFQSKPEAGIQAASYGTLLLGNGKGQFTYVAQNQSGLQLTGALRQFVALPNRKILAVYNGGSARVLGY